MEQIHSAYELIKEEKLSDIESVGYVLRHKKSGASIAIIENDDDNKVFYIGFRTPPKDSTGVAHIVEHTVLCGSDKYPVKDPFVELVKGSLNTFLNAMTYPDKTVYPVASTNDKDFDNLIDVYMDAVLHPNIYKYKEIFEQEGWHYELENEDGELTINGVVYNEMKGAFSSPEDVLQREILTSLFPDNTYALESGGDPKVIPSLTYEDFIAFHKKFYHPCNSYIYLYGNMDTYSKLEYLDKEYLSKYDVIEVDSQIPLQKAFEKPVDIRKEYSIASTDDGANSTYIARNYVVGDVTDVELYQAFDILDYALISSPGAPVKKALIDAGIGEDVSGFFDTNTRQPIFNISVRGANEEDKSRFNNIIDKTLREQVEKGIDKKAIRAAINANEFRLREADFGSYPKGLMYGLSILDSWLYEKDLPFIHLHGIDVFNSLKSKIHEGYFEKLVDDYLINNKHQSVVLLAPKAGLTSEDDEALKNKLKDIKAAMSSEEIKQIVEHTAYLKEYQSTPSTKEELMTIPMLKREDLKKEARPYAIDEYKVNGHTVVHHNIATTGIHYLNLVFDISDIGYEDLMYASLLEKILGYIDTENYSYTDFANEVNMMIGGLAPVLTMYEKKDDPFDVSIKMEVRAKFLYEDVEAAIFLILQMIAGSDFSDEKRIHELIVQQKSRCEAMLTSSGHLVAANRARLGFSKKALLKEYTAGIEFYEFLKKLDENFENEKEDIKSRLNYLLSNIFSMDRLLVSSTGRDRALGQAIGQLSVLETKLPLTGILKKQNKPKFSYKNEGIMDASQIQYVSRAGNLLKAGYSYNGCYKILKTILGYDYFWINVRVTGGAYGCMSGFNRDGEVFFVSYRDPNLVETKEIFEKTPEYIKNFEADERDMTKYIIGTISGMDTPLTPSLLSLRNLSAYLTGMTYERLQQERDEVLSATAEDIRALAEPVAALLKQDYFCVVGNEDNIKANEKLFDEIRPLFA